LDVKDNPCRSTLVWAHVSNVTPLNIKSGGLEDACTWVLAVLEQPLGAVTLSKYHPGRLVDALACVALKFPGPVQLNKAPVVLLLPLSNASVSAQVSTPLLAVAMGEIVSMATLMAWVVIQPLVAVA